MNALYVYDGQVYPWWENISNDIVYLFDFDDFLLIRQRTYSNTIYTREGFTGYGY